jgi:hypothetical protein
MILTVLVPTRGRSENAHRLLDACAATCVLADTKIVLGCDDDDDHRGYCRILAKDNAHGAFMRLPVGDRRGMVAGLNLMAERYAPTSDYVGFLGDDHLPVTPGWDKAFCDALAGKPAALAYGNDLLQGANIPTAVAMTASIPRTLGYMAPPELGHLYVDNAWLAWGHGLGAITYLPDVVIEHLHPVAGKADWDEGYRNVNAETSYSADRVAYEKYRTERLPADLEKLRAIR